MGGLQVLAPMVSAAFLLYKETAFEDPASVQQCLHAKSNVCAEQKHPESLWAQDAHLLPAQ
jgi:hypothetical protein